MSTGSAWQALGCAALAASACQLQPSPSEGHTPNPLPAAAPLVAPSQEGTLSQLRAEVDALRQENAALQRELERLRGSHSKASAGSLPASFPVELEARTLAGRAEQDKFLAQYNAGYVEDLYARALQATPEDPAALYLAARFAADPDKKLSLCEQAARLEPNYGFAYLCQSQAHQARGEGALALATAEKAASLSPAAEIEQNRKGLRRRSMDWFPQPLSGLLGETSVRREFALGPAITSVSLSNAKKGLDCEDAVIPGPFSTCAGVVCAEAKFSYVFEGPADPFYDHAELCGTSLIASDSSGKTLRSEAKLPCSRVESGASLSAPLSICLTDESQRIGELHLDLPGKLTPLVVPGLSLPNSIAPE